MWRVLLRIPFVDGGIESSRVRRGSEGGEGVSSEDGGLVERNSEKTGGHTLS